MLIGGISHALSLERNSKKKKKTFQSPTVIII